MPIAHVPISIKKMVHYQMKEITENQLSLRCQSGRRLLALIKDLAKSNHNLQEVKRESLKICDGLSEYNEKLELLTVLFQVTASGLQQLNCYDGTNYILRRRYRVWLHMLPFLSIRLSRNMSDNLFSKENESRYF